MRRSLNIIPTIYLLYRWRRPSLMLSRHDTWRGCRGRCQRVAPAWLAETTHNGGMRLQINEGYKRWQSNFCCLFTFFWGVSRVVCNLNSYFKLFVLFYIFEINMKNYENFPLKRPVVSLSWPQHPSGRSKTTCHHPLLWRRSFGVDISRRQKSTQLHGRTPLRERTRCIIM